MTSTKRKIELLSPAKNCEIGIAAINHGADAVYIGGPNYSAREKASNSIHDIEKLCRYAALYDAKVHVALNTLLYDSELEAARKIAFQFWDAGVDGLIVQDMAFLHMDMPPIPLHASTQCNNLTVEKVKFLEEVGFSQVVLGRELDLKQIKQIREQTKVPLEFFVHGSLCVSQSGQCYLSHFLGNRSANRGACAQPCRLPWSLKDAEGKTLIENRHLLSLKDLNNSRHLEQLIDAGISSFKIEGRLKDANYVKNVTAFYRQQIDAILSRRNDLEQASRGHCTFGFEVKPEKSFSRGFTDFFIEGRKKGIDSPFTPKSMGEYIGDVSWCNALCIELNTEKEIHNGDGFCFLDADNQWHGIRADVVKDKEIICNRPHGATRGTKIYRNFDNEWQKQIDGSTGKRKIAIELILSDHQKGFAMEARLKENPETTFSSTVDTEKIIANNPEKAEDNIRRKALQWGDTAFNPVEIKLNFEKSYLIPAALLGELKRNLVEALSQGLVNSHIESRQRVYRQNNDYPYPETQLSYLGNVINAEAMEFYKVHGVTEIEDGVEKAQRKTNLKVMTTKHCIRYANGMCCKITGEKADTLYLTNNNGTFRIDFDCKSCQMNIFTQE
jgi:Collagenase and related proteases